MVMFLVIFLLSFHAFLEKWPFLSAFIVPPDIDPPLGGPLGLPDGPSGALRRHQIVDISLVLKA